MLSAVKLVEVYSSFGHRTLLLGPGAPCHGAQVIVQQDNAGPHIEETYSAWMTEMFDSLGWMYEPQAPQGSYKY